MATDRGDTDFEPPHTSCPTGHVLAELQLYGHRPFQDDADPRPLPEADTDIFDALVSTLSDTRHETDHVLRRELDVQACPKFGRAEAEQVFVEEPSAGESSSASIPAAAARSFSVENAVSPAGSGSRAT